MADDVTHHSLIVPRDDRSLLAIPPLDQAPSWALSNRELFAQTKCTLHGRSLHELRTAGRQAVLVAAQAYTSALLQTDVPLPQTESIVLGGHQPELFHVGVWAKNFAMAGIARQIGAAAMNLVIDNDTLQETSIRIPVGSRESLRWEPVPFDQPRPVEPWEEATIRDRDLFRSFGMRVTQRLSSDWKFEPLIATAWQAAVRQSESSPRLCDALAALRATVEHRWGLANLELPISQLCQTEPFLWWAAHMLMRLPELHAAYNETVDTYRRVHRLRNRKQPVPDLERVDEWLEAPFWVWKPGATQRGRLFVRRVGNECELRYEAQPIGRIPFCDDQPLDRAVEALQQLSREGLRLRPRALTLTLFARVCLADLFVHGIGGARYDWMTDRLCERLFGIPAPGFSTVSGTLWLPLGGPSSSTLAQLRQLEHDRRDLEYNPERHLAATPWIQELQSRKATILAEAEAQRAAGQLKGHLSPSQHRALTAIRQELLNTPETATLRTNFTSQRKDLQHQLATNALTTNREYAFVLYPEPLVGDFLQPLTNLRVPSKNLEPRV